MRNESKEEISGRALEPFGNVSGEGRFGSGKHCRGPAMERGKFQCGRRNDGADATYSARAALRGCEVFIGNTARLLRLRIAVGRAGSVMMFVRMSVVR